MRLGYIVVFGLVLISIVTLGCVDKKDSNLETTTSSINATPPTILYDDQKFISWISTSVKVLGVDLDGLSSASSNVDLKNMEIYGRYLKEDSQKYLDEFNKFNISPSYMPMADEYKKALEDYYLAGKYTELGAKNVDAESIKLATSYAGEAGIHLKRATAMIPTS